MKVLSNKFWGHRNEYVKHESTVQFYKTFEEKPYNNNEEAYQYWKELILYNLYGSAHW